MIEFLTMSGSALSDAIGAVAGTAVGGIIIIIAIIWGISMLVLRPTVAVITWVVKRVWYADAYKARKQQYYK